MQGHTASQLTLEFSQQKTATGRRVVAGQSCKFLIEVLKAEAEAQRLGVFEKKFAGLGDLGRSRRLQKYKTLYPRGHRGHRGESFVCFRHRLPLCTLCHLW
ncbi:hypothetical protein SBA7_1030018 [Candidatus Sulfotelmatobacter sp. SbA7]|nr:hypothetical protein SBA7_1030018 [Candidatus Sulfotelmatobacter sp. SbA7]